MLAAPIQGGASPARTDMTTQLSKRTRAAGVAALSLDPILVDRHTAAALVALSEPTLERLVREGAFPSPRKVSNGRVAWLMAELRDWSLARPKSDLMPPPNTSAPKRPMRRADAPDASTTS
jgi:prophage regulatory protein